MAIEEKIVSFEKLSRYDQQIKAYIDHELSQIETGTDTSDATAMEDKVFLDETFYAGGQKRTGTFTIESEVNSQNELIASIKTALEGKTAGSGGDTLKTLLDAKKSTYYLFYNAPITTAEGLISYNATENVTNMARTFYSCKKLTFVPLLNTSNVTNMSDMFNGCTALTEVPLFDTGKVTDMSGMFQNCKALTSVPQFDTSNATNMESLFYQCESLIEAPQLDTSKVTNMSNMFQNCKALTSVPQFDTSNATSVSYLFSGCSALTEFPDIDTSKATSFNYMLSNCKKITNVEIDMSSATSASGMIRDCTSLTEAVCLNMGKLGYLDYFVNSCTNLKKLKLQGLTSNASSYSFATNCSSLELIDFRGATGVLRITNTSAFTKVPSTCKVVIPDSLYDTWTNATNWSAINVTWVKESEYTEE